MLVRSVALLIIDAIGFKLYVWKFADAFRFVVLYCIVIFFSFSSFSITWWWNKVAQTNRQTDRHYENNDHLAVNQWLSVLGLYLKKVFCILCDLSVTHRSPNVDPTRPATGAGRPDRCPSLLQRNADLSSRLKLTDAASRTVYSSPWSYFVIARRRRTPKIPRPH